MYTCCQTYNSLIPCSFRMKDGTWKLVWKCTICDNYYTAEFNINTVNVVINDLNEISQNVLDDVIDIIEHDPLDKFQLKTVLSGIDLFKEERDAHFITNIDTNGIQLECPNCLYKPLRNDNNTITCMSCGTTYKLTEVPNNTDSNISKYIIIGKEVPNSTLSQDTSSQQEEDVETIEEESQKSLNNEDDAEDIHMYGFSEEDTQDTTLQQKESTTQEEAETLVTNISDIPYNSKYMIKQANKLFTPKIDNKVMDATSITSGIRIRIEIVFKDTHDEFIEQYTQHINIYNTKIYDILLDSINISVLPAVKLEYQYDEKGNSVLHISDYDDAQIDIHRVLDVILHEKTRDNVIREDGVFILPMVKIQIINETPNIISEKLRNGYLYIELSPLVTFNIQYHKNRGM